MPKFMLVFFGAYDEYDGLPEEAKRKQYEAVGRWWEQNERYLRGGEQLEHERTAKTVRTGGGPVRVTDGPFIESKEGVGGFAVVEVPDRATAIELAKAWPAGGVEVRPIVEGH